MGNPRRKSDFDVLENVFGGVRISTDDEQREPRRNGPDLRPRPWLLGLTMSEVRVSLADEDDEPRRR